MTLEILALVAVTGLAISLFRWLASRFSGQEVAEIDLEERVTDGSVGVQDGDRLDVWVPSGTRVPARIVRLVRGKPEAGRGLRLSLYEGTDDAPPLPGGRLVRTWLGPYPDEAQAVLVEVTLSVGRFGGLRVHAIDKGTGRRLEIIRDERTAAPSTAITTRAATVGDEEDPR